MTPEQRARKDLSDLVARYQTKPSPTQKALDLALCYLGALEPGDSRAVSDEFVAMASVQRGDASPNVMAVIDAALAREYAK